MSARASIVALLALGGPAAEAAAPAGPIVLDRAHPATAIVAAPAETPWEACAFLLEGPPARRAARDLVALCRRPGAAPEFLPLAAGLAGAGSLAVDPLGEGRVRLLVGVIGGVRSFVLGARDAPAIETPRLEDPQVDPASLAARPDLDGDTTPDLLQMTWDGLAAWRWTLEGFVPLRSAPLPRRASAAGGEVIAWSPTLLPDERPSSPRWTFPSSWSGDRLRLERVEVGAEGAGPSCSAWVSPGAAVGVAAAAVTRDEPPRLFALLEPADRIALLGERTLVASRLVCRASGRGEAPEWSVETRLSNYVAAASIELRDATGDGVDDLVTVGLTGRMKPDLEVAVYAGDGAGGYARQPRRWSRKVERLSGTSSFRRDLTGDGLPDLLHVEGNEVWLARGVPPEKDLVPLERKPSLELSAPQGIEIERFGDALPAPGGKDAAPGWLLFAARRTGEAAGNALLVLQLP